MQVLYLEARSLVVNRSHMIWFHQIACHHHTHYTVSSQMPGENFSGVGTWGGGGGGGLQGLAPP